MWLFHLSSPFSVSRFALSAANFASRAIRELRPEEKGRRLEVWLDPPSYSEQRPGIESCTYVRKERVDEVMDWYRACLARKIGGS